MRARRPIAGAVLAIGVMAGAGACSSIQPALSEYAITTGHGNLSNQDVIRVTSPGVHAKVGSGTTTWYFPANVRNYITGTGGDRETPTAEFTAAIPGQPNSAISAYVYTYVGWEVNPAITVNNSAMVSGQKMQWSFATHFLQFCLKYGCGTYNPQDAAGNAAKERSSDPGWLNMVQEIFPRAIDNATRSALVNFQPNVWTAAGEGQWPKLADQISANLSAELQALDGSKAESQPDYFCGPGSTTTNCKPFLVQVSRIAPTDPGIVQAYQQSQQAAYAQQAAAARLNLARKLYGSDANWTLAMIDILARCQAQKVPCNFYLGQAPIHP